MTDECPECGVSLLNKNRETHAFVHWNVRKEGVNSLPTEARKRYLAVLDKSGKGQGAE